VLSRRDFITGVSVVALCAAMGAPTTAWAQRAQQAPPPGPATVPLADLAEPSPLGDMTMGKDDAPVTIIEYASMTCPHCAHFTVNTFPKLKEKYIDTGKVRFIFREFPLDPLAAAASMLARCADKEKFFPVLDLLFHTQAQWAVQSPLEPLFNVAKQAGYTREAFDACIDTRNNENSRKILSGIESTRNRGADKLKVASTPTFFINGKRVTGSVSIEELDKEIAPYLKA
jgi:protein-disulfide isomerase